MHKNIFNKNEDETEEKRCEFTERSLFVYTVSKSSSENLAQRKCTSNSRC